MGIRGICLYALPLCFSTKGITTTSVFTLNLYQDIHLEVAVQFIIFKYTINVYHAIKVSSEYVYFYLTIKLHFDM